MGAVCRNAYKSIHMAAGLALAACTSTSDASDDGRVANRLAPPAGSGAMTRAWPAVARGEAAIDPRTLGFEAAPVPVDLGTRRASQYFVNREARTELFFGPRGDCNITSFAANGRELREAVSDAVEAAATQFQTLYSGPNNTGVAMRDVYCTDLEAGGSGSIIVTTVEGERVPGLPTLQVTAMTETASCAALSEGSVSAIPKP